MAKEIHNPKVYADSQQPSSGVDSENASKDITSESIGKVIEGFVSKMSLYPSLLSDAKCGGIVRRKEIVEGFIGCKLSAESYSCKEIRSRKILYDFIREVEELKLESSKMIMDSLLIGMFSCFDAYLAELLKVSFSLKEELYNKFNDRALNYCKLKELESAKSIRELFLNDYIEEMRRKSYVDQIKELEKFFKFEMNHLEQWPSFVECSQRRNIITHCSGVVSEQYVESCLKAGYSFQTEVKPGMGLPIDENYFHYACNIIILIGIVVGQLMWRALLKNKEGECDDALNRLLYGMLDKANWSSAEQIGKFALSQKIKKDDCKKMISINYAQSLYYSGQTETCRAYLEDLDLSGASLPYRLGKAVLLDDFENAVKIMGKLGIENEQVSKNDYHLWPLFNQFRETEIFKQKYLEMFGINFDDDGFMLNMEKQGNNMTIQFDGGL